MLISRLPCPQAIPSPPPPPPFGVSSSRLSLASLALRLPRWYAVALFFWVRAIYESSDGNAESLHILTSASISLIFSTTDICENSVQNVN